MLACDAERDAQAPKSLCVSGARRGEQLRRAAECQDDFLSPKEKEGSLILSLVQGHPPAQGARERVPGREPGRPVNY